MSDTTEHNILNSIPDLDDNTPDTNDDTSVSATETPASTAADTSEAVGGAGDEGRRVNTAAEPNNQPAPATRRDGLTEVPSKDNPGARDLVDPATGQTVARGGIERRIFEGAQRVHRENQQLMQRVTAAETAAKGITEVNALATRLNLSPQDQSTAFNIMRNFYNDPVKTLEQLVIEVKSKGYTIPFLETGVTPGMDAAAIQRMLDAKMAPLTEARTQQEQAAQYQAEAKTALDSFLDGNPEAGHNLSVLGEMLTAQPGLSLNDAYVKMIKWCSSNGLDYSQPLKPQIEAKQRASQPAAVSAQTPAQQPPSTAPLPFGRTTNSAAPVAAAKSFDENSSWADIIRQSMRETGMSAS